MSRRRRRPDATGPDGIVCIDKPAGPTSFTVLRRVARRLDVSRAGHAGTLDPAATGLLVVLLGEATKLSQWVMGRDKTYLATVRFGSSTDTLDAEGAITAEAEIPPGAVTAARIAAVIPRFLGEIAQVPPVYSALKRGGRSLMSRARAGEAVEVDPRPVRCDRIEVVDVEGSTAVLRLATGAGFYVRSFARDLGLALGLPAHLAALRRERVGPWTLASAADPDQVTVADVAPLAQAVPDLPCVSLTEEDTAAVAVGKRVLAAGDLGRALLIDPQGRARAMAVRDEEGRWKVARGFVVAGTPEPPPRTARSTPEIPLRASFPALFA